VSPCLILYFSNKGVTAVDSVISVSTTFFSVIDDSSLAIFVSELGVFDMGMYKICPIDNLSEVRLFLTLRSFTETSDLRAIPPRVSPFLIL